MLKQTQSVNLPIFGKNDAITVKNFETLDEFNQFYNLHRDEIDSLTTNKINKIYKINGYKVTRRKVGDSEEKSLCFRQLLKTELTPSSTPEPTTSANIEELEESISNMSTKMKALELEMSKIKQQLIEIIRVINHE